MQLTEHFQDTELDVSGQPARLVANATFLCTTLLEPIRAKFGPIAVDCGYRNIEHNAAVGGKTASFHLFEGTKAAADIVPVDAGVTMQAVFDWIRLESGLPFDKVIYETDPGGAPGCLHLQVDSAADPRRQAFTGQTGAGEVYLPAEVK
jgi:hypothetical protein